VLLFHVKHKQETTFFACLQNNPTGPGTRGATATQPMQSAHCRTPVNILSRATDGSRYTPHMIAQYGITMVERRTWNAPTVVPRAVFHCGGESPCRLRPAGTTQAYETPSTWNAFSD